MMYKFFVVEFVKILGCNGCSRFQWEVNKVNFVFLVCLDYIIDSNNGKYLFIVQEELDFMEYYLIFINFQIIGIMLFLFYR